MKEARPYSSPLRGEQAERTRDRILEALAASLSSGGEEVDRAKLAQAAGVSLRTVYHHFPDRKALLTALAAWVESRVLPGEEGPRGPRDLPAYALRLFRGALEQESLTRATLAPGVAAQIRGTRRKRRLAAIEQSVSETGVPREDAALVAALLKHLLSGDTGVALIDRYGVSREDLPGLAAWATAVLVAAAARRPGPKGFTPPDAGPHSGRA